MSETDENKLAVFKGKQIRRILHLHEWFFSIIDVVGVLTDSENPRRYWSDLKRNLAEKEGFSEVYEKIVQLKLEASDGKKYETDTANEENKHAAQTGGKIAGDARRQLEKESGRKVMTSENYLQQKPPQKKLASKK